MRIPISPSAFFLLTVLALGATAQPRQAPPPKLPPIETPPPMPSAQADAPTLRVTTTEVLVPTLVEKKGGGILYGLKPSDFVLEDNGVPQKIKVQPEMDTAPVALVVAVEQGGVSVLEFDKLARLGPLLDVFLSDPRSQVALVGFDSEPQLIQDFTHDGDQVNTELTQLEPGDGGAAILDTVNYGVTLLESAAKGIPARAAADQRGARPREQAHEACGVDKDDRRIGCAGAERELFAGAGGVGTRCEGQRRRPNDEYGERAGDGGEGLQEECGQRSGDGERGRVHDVCGRQGV